MRIIFVFLSLFLFSVACGPEHINKRSKGSYVPKIADIKTTDKQPEDVVVIAQIEIPVQMGKFYLSSSSYSVVTVLAPNTRFSINTSQFVIPSMTNDLLDFGSIAVSDLFTNRLKLCGPNGNQKCNKALIRVYTSGTAGPGFWNDDGYGVELSAGLPGQLQIVGLGQNNAITIHQYIIPSNRNSVRLSDFNPSPIFKFMGDFTDAGAGTYSTTIVLELALSL